MNFLFKTYEQYQSFVAGLQNYNLTDAQIYHQYTQQIGGYAAPNAMYPYDVNMNPNLNPVFQVAPTGSSAEYNYTQPLPNDSDYQNPDKKVHF